MVLEYEAEPPKELLLVVHDFEARSSDELSLTKGDRIELIERDDDFGDGWYFGKHMTSNKTGLFPEVYTTIAPRLSASTAVPSSNFRGLPKTGLNNGPPSLEKENPSVLDSTSSPNAQDESPSDNPAQFLGSDGMSSSPLPPPLNTTTPPSQSTRPLGNGTSTAPPLSTPPPSQKTVGLGRVNSQTARGEDSPVMNETLTVIDEHITDMNTPRHSLAVSETRGTNGSGSEYSSQLDHRLSYIHGQETDEEEVNARSAVEISAWSPSKVSLHLRQIGVDDQHCEIFKEQEISGEVLLGMDRESLFLKEFDLGSVGRRLRTWQKIKQLQDEAKGLRSAHGSGPAYLGTEMASRNMGEDVSSNAGNPVLSVPQVNGRSLSRTQSQQNRPQEQVQSAPRTHNSSPVIPVNPSSAQGSPTRPSAASVRELNHSRRHSSVDYKNTGRSRASTGGATLQPPRNPGTPHQKQPSFDRSWTMGAASSAIDSRPTPSMTSKDSFASHKYTGSSDQKVLDSPGYDSGFAGLTQVDLDRGYFSGGELESRKPRNVLRKRESSNHSRNSSYTEEQRHRSATAHLRHSRIGSADSVRENSSFMKGASLSSAPPAHHARAFRERFRKSSVGDSTASMVPFKDQPSPTVTKLDQEQPNQSLPSMPKRSSKSRAVGLRAISDAVTGSERALISKPTESNPSSAKDSPIQSPSPTGSTTPSGSKSFELDSNETPRMANASSRVTSAKGTARRKSKKETSAYIRGLEKKSPQEQMINCDYSGWMKKKSTNLMTTWKPRLFVLRGRRLSYYYSETDEQEKGLIDISSHRVLPADNDRITGLHATLTGAATSPTSPQDAQTPTLASTEAAAHTEDSSPTPGQDSMFIFKLLPPRMGLTKAVNFTKPTIHYFAVDNVMQGRLWMAALMKATIDRDDSKALVTTYQQKTISLGKARQMRQRPPALMGVDEKLDESADTPENYDKGLNIKGVTFDGEADEDDSGVSGVGKKLSEASKSTASDPDVVTTLDPSQEPANKPGT
ncbi:MAG: polar growth protein [Sclerophora amabilis]|nr:MAG: polar growth protein [Sclerophora amabilis]